SAERRGSETIFHGSPQLVVGVDQFVTVGSVGTDQARIIPLEPFQPVSGKMRDVLARNVNPVYSPSGHAPEMRVAWPNTHKA
ncbi:MAG: hypothetical protein J0H10_16230, partial [Alphaproteobacteria bacterium]|nr:hypothetical protein [Alphaproteobacteria bacterium]